MRALAGLLVVSLVAHVCAQCPGGYTGPDGGPCTACVAGKYKTASGSSACSSCSSGQYNVAPGGTSSAACTLCPGYSTSVSASIACNCNAGYTGPGVNTSCVACVPGKYKDVSGSAICTDCPAGKYGAGAAVARLVDCRDCYLNTRGLTPAGSSTAEGCICNAGSYYSADAYGGSCLDCAAGDYKGTIGNQVCTKCASATYANAHEAATACIACPANSVCKASVSCNELQSCTCNSAYYGSPYDRVACTACPANTGSVCTVASQCAVRRDCLSNHGYYGYDGAAAACPSNAGSNCFQPTIERDTMCFVQADCLCNAGYTGPAGGPCVGPAAPSCPNGTVWDARPNPQRCTTRVENMSACPMLNGLWTNASAAQLAAFDAVTNQTMTRYWTELTKTQSLSNATGCGRQAPSRFLDFYCGLVLYYAVPADTIFAPCLAGWQSLMPCYGECASFESCLPTSSTSICAQISPPAGVACLGPAGQAGACVCGAGATRAGGACAACTEGTYKADAGDGACATCAGGLSSPAGSVGPDACACGAGATRGNITNSTRAGGACVACAAGTYKATDGDGACVACGGGSGTYSAGGATSIAECLCAPGFSGPNGGPCTVCVSGTYKAGAGDGACAACGAGEVSPAGSDACACGAGYTGTGGGGCTQCTAGKYKSVAGSGACSSCSSGKWVPVNGSTSSAACECPNGTAWGARPNPQRCTKQAQNMGACPILNGLWTNASAAELAAFDAATAQTLTSIYSSISAHLSNATACGMQSPSRFTDFYCQSFGGSDTMFAPCFAGGQSLMPCLEQCVAFESCMLTSSPSACAQISPAAGVACLSATGQADACVPIDALPPVCAAGATRAGGACVACAEGTYKAGAGDYACAACGAGSVSPAGSVGPDACVCGAGFRAV